MIRARRQAHRWIVTGLALGLPLLFGLGLAARPEVPPASLDAILGPAVPLAPALETHGWTGLPVRIDRTAAGWRFQATQDLRLPDVHLYRADAAPAGDELPPAAEWVGPLQGTDPLAAPGPAPAWWILYSVAHARVVGSQEGPR